MVAANLVDAMAQDPAARHLVNNLNVKWQNFSLLITFPIISANTGPSGPVNQSRIGASSGSTVLQAQPCKSSGTAVTQVSSVVVAVLTWQMTYTTKRWKACKASGSRICRPAGSVALVQLAIVGMSGISSLVVQVWLADKADKRDVGTRSRPRQTGWLPLPVGKDGAAVRGSQLSVMNPGSRPGFPQTEHGSEGGGGILVSVVGSG
ncbi:hypothetical protein B0T18DRAFT_489542 [Schizothecium vesticola]|uniref:Uncharacterized protein n=1 Tax=Schizothecium vesticola TaxID=314040 RepID=A0AA40K5Y6_9PEZI|nr:hypothetical protein B0T18DRAFT_489542 [Schizothecium vesticola]